jgi:hypothetical protein
VPLPQRYGGLQPVSVILDGERRVDDPAIAARFGVSRTDLRMASADVVP